LKVFAIPQQIVQCHVRCSILGICAWTYYTCQVPREMMRPVALTAQFMICACITSIAVNSHAECNQTLTMKCEYIYIYIYIYIKGRCVSDLERFQSVSHDVSNRCCRADRRRRLCRKCHSVSAAAAAAAAALVGCMDMTLYSIASQALLLLLQCAVRNICSAIYNLAETRSYT